MINRFCVIGTIECREGWEARGSGPKEIIEEILLQTNYPNLFDVFIVHMNFFPKQIHSSDRSNNNFVLKESVKSENSLHSL